MTVGHTKFSCDRNFGVLKRKTNRTELWTLYDIASAVNESGIYDMLMKKLQTYFLCSNIFFVILTKSYSGNETSTKCANLLLYVVMKS